MKKFIMLLAVLLLLSAQTTKAQTTYNVWNPAKAVTFIGDFADAQDVDVILNTTQKTVTLDVMKEHKVTELKFNIESVVEESPDKTVYLLENMSTMSMFKTDVGEVCKIVIPVKSEESIYDKIVFLFYM